MRFEYYQTAITEINLDHIEECEYCGNITNVVDRIYSDVGARVNTGLFASSTNFDDAKAAANERSLTEAGHKLATHINWHRCTRCGFYGSKALDLMKPKLSRLQGLSEHSEMDIMGNRHPLTAA